MQLLTVNPKLCHLWQFADRSGFEYGDMHAFIRDIKTNGQIEPVILRPHPTLNNEYEVIAGARRWKACFEANIPLKGVLQDLTDQQATIAQLKENQQIPPEAMGKWVAVTQEGIVAMDKRYLIS